MPTTNGNKVPLLSGSRLAEPCDHWPYLTRLLAASTALVRARRGRFQETAAIVVLHDHVKSAMTASNDLRENG